MSEKDITIFLPQGCDGVMVFDELVNELDLAVEIVPSVKKITSKRSASAGTGHSYILLSYYEESSELINELLAWKRPTEKYKEILAKCSERISIDYRDSDRIGVLFGLIRDRSGCSPSGFVVDNGFGCLLTVEDIVYCLEKNSHWHWEREEFPELPEVAKSEWKD